MALPGHVGNQEHPKNKAVWICLCVQRSKDVLMGRFKTNNTSEVTLDQ